MAQLELGGVDNGLEAAHLYQVLLQLELEGFDVGLEVGHLYQVLKMGTVEVNQVLVNLTWVGSTSS